MGKRQPMMKHVPTEKNTKGRETYNKEIMPRFASLFESGQKIIMIGKHSLWDYSPFFNNPAKQCEFYTTDISESVEPDIVDDALNSKLEDNSVDGFIYVGMDQDISQTGGTEKAVSEMHRALKPGGRLLIGFTGYGETSGRVFKFGEAIQIMNGWIIDHIDIVYMGFVTERYSYGEPICYFIIARK